MRWMNSNRIENEEVLPDHQNDGEELEDPIVQSRHEEDEPKRVTQRGNGRVPFHGPLVDLQKARRLSVD